MGYGRGLREALGRRLRERTVRLNQAISRDDVLRRHTGDNGHGVIKARAILEPANQEPPGDRKIVI
jgi:hypothetical protein